MSRVKIISFALILIAIGLACGTTVPDAPVATIDQQAIETKVAAEVYMTLTAVPVATITHPPVSTALPTEEPTPVPTEKPVCQPRHPGAQILNQPLGFGGNINTLAIQFFDASGNLLGNVQTAGMTWLDPNQIHIGGGYSQGIPNLPLVYHSLESGGMLKKSQNSNTNPLSITPGLITLTGAEGDSTIAYSAIDPNQTSEGWTSYLYAGDLSSIPTATPILTRSEGDGLVIYPLAVHSQGGIHLGVWYTLSLWGVGNINFPPYNGLYYYQISDGQVTEFLPTTDRLAGFSSDQTLAAYIPGAGGAPGEYVNFFTLKNLTNCQEFAIPYNTNTNLGGGLISFSPDNQYLAWLEASGPNNMEAQMRLRVAKTNGDILRDALFQELSGLVGGQNPVYIKPLGWLATHLLLLEISTPTQNSPLIVVWAPDTLQPLDPALGANQSAPLAEGVFAGFLYP
jgi:hypothetical protein